MQFYCRACGGNYALTSEETERMVYALDAHICDTESVVKPTQMLNENGVYAVCVLQAYKTTAEDRPYSEYADVMTDLRRRSGVYRLSDDVRGCYVNTRA